MTKHELDCCVVRDLLPGYAEKLTEPQTTTLLEKHLQTCEACRAQAAAMQLPLPVEQAPARPLRFLQRVKRTRLLAAAITIVLTLACMAWLYGQEFHYANTEAGRLAAVEDYIPLPEDSSIQHGVAPGTPLRVVAHAEAGKYLYLYYAADNKDHVHGIMRLDRGLNGKYRALGASVSPFPYTAGVWGENVRGGKEDGYSLFALYGQGCGEIAAFRVVYSLHLAGAEGAQTYEMTYPVTEADFLWLMEHSALAQSMGIAAEDILRLSAEQVVLLDAAGRDVTAQYADPAVEQSWGGGKGTAEQGLLYVYMAIVLAFGMMPVYYFLRKD